MFLVFEAVQRIINVLEVVVKPPGLTIASKAAILSCLEAQYQGPNEEEGGERNGRSG